METEIILGEIEEGDNEGDDKIVSLRLGYFKRITLDPDGWEVDIDDKVMLVIKDKLNKMTKEKLMESIIMLINEAQEA